MDYKCLESYASTNCLGVNSGRSGLALIYYLSSDETVKDKKVMEHLDYLVDNIYTCTSLSFFNGLLGIGWTMEFLSQKGYSLAVFDNLLAEIDDIIYKWVNFRGVSSFRLNEGYLGCLLYFCFRLKGNRIQMPYKELSMKECTILVLIRLYKEAQKQSNASFSYCEWMQLHILAGIFQNMNIHKHIATDVLRETRAFLHNNRCSLKHHPSNSFMDMLYHAFERSEKGGAYNKIFFYGV